MGLIHWQYTMVSMRCASTALASAFARGFAEVGQHHAFKAGGQGVVAVVGGLVGEQHHLVAHGRPQVRKLGGDHFGSAGVQAVMVQPDALAC